MSYNIQITKTETVRKTLPKRWEKVGTKEIEREKMLTGEPPSPRTRIEDAMGYTPEVETLVEQTTTLFSGTVDSLDTAVRVIEALNSRDEPTKSRKERSDKGHARKENSI